MKTLHILWTSGDPDVARGMVLMYATNSMLRHMWDQVVVIAWGASPRLIRADEDIRERIRQAQQAGVRFTACISCVRMMEAEEIFAELGIEAKSWGQPLTDLLQEGAPLITI